MSGPDLAVVANTRFPSRRAQGLQVAQSSAAFARAGCTTSLLVADRRAHVELPPGQDAFDWYGVPPGMRPAVVRVDCVDWIERLPRALQYVPARLQELTFSRSAARLVRERFGSARVLSRETECALRLVRAGHERVFLEIHRVPGSRLRRRWLLEACAGARGVLAISGGVREDLVALGVDAARITVEHDGFEASRFARMPGRAEARQELGLPADAPVVVYTGGLLAWKGVDVLVEAARAMPDAYFAIAGGLDGDVAALRARAGGLANVRIDGFQAPERVALYLAAGDVGVVPNRAKPAISARYTSPLKAFEAMAAGLPMVVSDLPALREILRPDAEAVFVAPDDPKSLAAGLRRLLGDAGLRQRMSATLRERSIRHGWDARAARILGWMEAREAG